MSAEIAFDATNWSDCRFADQPAVALLLTGLADDLPEALARGAHAGTSFSPEQRGTQEREGYARMLREDWNQLAELADTPEKLAQLIRSFGEYRIGYRERYQGVLTARARCVSTMIAGRSNFPVRRQEKANASADKRLAEAMEMRALALGSMRKALRPELRPIMAGDADAVQRIDEKLAKASALQDRMVSSNAAIRKHAKAGREAQLEALQALGHPKSIAEKLLEPDFAGRIGFADYELKNNSANIRRMQERSEALVEAKAAVTEIIEGPNARFENCPAESRVRLFFPGKPSAEQRAALKNAGFRWAPSLECWQAYRNERAIALGKRHAGIDNGA